MSNSSPTKESTQVVAIELILSWTLSQVNSGSGSILSNSIPSGLGNPMRPQSNRSLQDINLPLCILLPHCQIELLRRVGFIPAPQETHRDLSVGHPLHHRLVHLHGKGVLLLQLQVPLLQVSDIPPQGCILKGYQFECKSNQTRCPHLLHSLLLIEELGPQDSGIPQTGIHDWNHLLLLVVIQRQTSGDPLLLEIRSLHVMKLPSPLQPTSNHQIPDVKILEMVPLLLSVGLDVG